MALDGSPLQCVWAGTLPRRTPLHYVACPAGQLCLLRLALGVFSRAFIWPCDSVPSHTWPLCYDNALGMAGRGGASQDVRGPVDPTVNNISHHTDLTASPPHVRGDGRHCLKLWGVLAQGPWLGMVRGFPPPGRGLGNERGMLEREAPVSGRPRRCGQRGHDGPAPPPG